MAEIDKLEVAVSAQVQQYVSAMQQVAAATMAATGHMGTVTQAAEKASSAHRESAGAIGLAVEGYHLAAEAVAKAAESFGELGRTAIEAANNMDPGGAVKWTAATEDLKRSFMTLAGTIGKEVRPAVESVMHSLADVFKRATELDWGKVGSALLTMLKKAGDGIKTWGEKMLDFLSWPFRQLVGIVEYAVADTLMIIGRVEKALGGTAIGKKMGLDSESGSALIGTANDMMKQSKTIRDSLGGAMGEVAKGFGMAMDAAIKAVANSPAAQALKEAFKPKKGEKGEGYATELDIQGAANEFNIRLRNQSELFKQQQQADSLHIQSVRQAAAEQRQAMIESYNAAKQALQEAKSKLGSDSQSGNIGALAEDQQALAAALAALHNAGAASIKSAQEAAHAEGDISNKLEDKLWEATDAFEKARKAADAASREAIATGHDPKAEEANREAQETLKQLTAEKDALVGQYAAAESAASKLRTAAAKTAVQIGTNGAHEEAQIRMDAAKRATAFYTSTFSNLAKTAAGNVGGAMLSGAQQGFAAGGPVGAAVGAGAALLEQSKGMKDLQAAMDGILQPLADAIGQLLEPLVPIVKQVGEAIGPLIRVLGEVFGVAGKVLATALQPLVPVIQVLAEVLSAILEPVLLVASLITELQILFDPLIIALRILTPALKKVAEAVHVVVHAIESVWNSILGVLESVFDSLAHALPGDAGDAMRGIYTALQGMEIHANGAAAALDTTGMAATDAARAVAEYALMQDEARAQLYKSLHLDALAAQAQAQVDARQAEVNAIDGVTSAMVHLSQATLDAAKSWGDANKRVQDDRAKAAADYAAYKYLTATGQKDAAAQALKNYNSDQSQAAVDAIAAEIARVQMEIAQYGAGATEASSHEGNNGMSLQDELSKLLMLQAAQVANTSATSANTKATQALTAALTNTPAGFRVAAYEYAAQAGAGPSVSGTMRAAAQSSLRGASAVTYYVDRIEIKVDSKNPDDFAGRVEDALIRRNFQRRGVPISGPGEF